MRSAAMLSTVLFVASVCSAAEEGLVAHYPCDEGQGTTLRDASDHGNEGAISGYLHHPTHRSSPSGLCGGSVVY